MQRFNYHAAIFAANGYSENTERYALAHQVFLIDYSHVESMRPIVDALLALEIEDIGELVQVQGEAQPDGYPQRISRGVRSKSDGRARRNLFGKRYGQGSRPFVPQFGNFAALTTE